MLSSKQLVQQRVHQGYQEVSSKKNNTGVGEVIEIGCSCSGSDNRVLLVVEMVVEMVTVMVMCW